MDNQYNQQTNGNFSQQGNTNPQDNTYQQGNAYQQGMPYPQGTPYQQGNAYQQGTPYQQGNAYQQGTPYQQGNAYQQGATYPQGNAYQQGNPYPQGNPYQQANTYQQPNSYINDGYGNRNQGGSYQYGSNPERQKAPNIFQQFGLSFIPTRYDRLTRVGIGSMIGFVTLLVLLATVVLFLDIAIVFSPSNMREWVEQLPDFEVRGGHLFMEEDFLYDEGGIFVYMTQDIEAFTYDDASGMAEEGYSDIILVGQDRISVMQNGEYQQLDFDSLGSDMEISRDWIVDQLLPIIMVVIVIVFLFFFIGRVCWYFLSAAIYLVFGLIIAAIMKKELSTVALYKTAVYAKVLMFVAAAFLSAIPFVHKPMPLLLRIIITLAFMGAAIAKLPDHR